MPTTNEEAGDSTRDGMHMLIEAERVLSEEIEPLIAKLRRLLGQARTQLQAATTNRSPNGATRPVDVFSLLKSDDPLRCELERYPELGEWLTHDSPNERATNLRALVIVGIRLRDSEAALAVPQLALMFPPEFGSPKMQLKKLQQKATAALAWLREIKLAERTSEAKKRWMPHRLTELGRKLIGDRAAP